MFFFGCRVSYPLRSEVRTHVVPTTVFATGVYAHSPVARTFFCAQRAHCTHAWFKDMKRYVACACRLSSSCLHLLPSHVSPVSVCCSGHFETNLTDALVHTVLPNFPDPKTRVKRTLHEDEQFGYLAKSVSNTMCCMSLRTMRQQSKWLPKVEVPQWGMFHELTEMLCIGCLTGFTGTPKSQILYIDTKHQLADMLSEGNFTRDEWNKLLHLLNISHFSSTCCAKNSSLISCANTMSNRMQEQKEEERSVAKSKSTAMNVSSDVPTISSSAKSPIASMRSGDTQSYGETRKQDEKNFKNRRSVEFSSAAARCIPWRVNGHSHVGKLSPQKRSQAMCIFPNLKLGVKKLWQGNRLLIKQLRVTPCIQ